MRKRYLVLIIFFASLVRLISLNQSLWLDEATTAQVVKHFNFVEIINKFSPRDFHPPLYYLFMKSWTNIFGYSEIALRMPSIFFSLMAGWIIYLLGGVWAAAIVLFNPLVVYYSQEARMYMMATFFLTTAFYFFKNKKWVWFGLFSILSFYTFYGSIFLIASFFIYLLYKKEYKESIVSGLIFVAGLGLISSLLLQQLTNSKTVLAQVANWSGVLGKANLKNLFLIPIKFVIGRIDFHPKWVYYAVAGLWSAFVWFLAVKSGRKNKLLLFLLVFPIGAGFFVSFATPLLQYFRFIYLVPILALILAKSPQRKIITLGFIIFSLTYLLLPQFHREDWKSVAANLPDNKSVYMISSSSDPVKYYKPDLKINELTNLRLDSLPKKITVIPYTATIHGVDYKKILTERKYRLINKKSFRELELEEWSL